MNDTHAHRRAGADGALATPHIDPAWRETFIIELRLADVPGDQIGDALATVDAHCAESGESATEAFGDPADYARTLHGEQPPEGLGLSVRTALGLVCGVVALVLVPRAVDAWLDGTAVGVSAGDLVALALCLGLAGFVMARPGPVMGWIMRHRWSIFALPFAVLIAMILPQALWRQEVAEPGWGPVLGAGLLLLVLNVALTWPDMSTPDPIRDPRQPRPQRAPRPWLLALMFPFLTLVVLGMDAVVRLFA